MERQEALELIEGHRKRIDDLDRRIVPLLNERSRHSLAIRALKPAAGMELFDAVREDEILERIAAYNEGPMLDGNVKEIYAALLKVMKEVPSPDDGDVDER